MPRYYFNVIDGKSTPDVDGTDLPDLSVAYRSAVRMAGEILQDEADALRSDRDWKMDVVDHQGFVIFSLLFVTIDAPCLTQRSSA